MSRLEKVVPVFESEGKPLHFSAIHAQCNFLKGKVLTVIDAVGSNPTQTKAVKDLIHCAFAQQLNYIRELCGINSFEIAVSDGVIK